MLDDEDWKALICGCAQGTADTVAETFKQSWGSASRPVLFLCTDGHHYVLKGPQVPKTPFNESVVATLGGYLHAPIPPTALVELPILQCQIEPNVAHMLPGLVHGSRLEPDCSDEREGLQHVSEPENRMRFAVLAILYTWMGASDHQFIYKKQPPRLVFSYDHGHFFCAGKDWTVADLDGAPVVTELDSSFGVVGLTAYDLVGPYADLAAIEAEDIAQAVARPPTSWGVTMEERTALCRYLQRRQQQVLALRSTP